MDQWVLMSAQRAKVCPDGQLASAFWTMEGWGPLERAAIYRDETDPSPLPGDDDSIVRVDESTYSTSKLWRFFLKNQAGEDIISLAWAQNSNLALDMIRKEHGDMTPYAISLIA